MTNHNWQFQTEQSLVENHGLKLDEFEKIVVRTNANGSALLRQRTQSY